jgi:hypothetical protein
MRRDLTAGAGLALLLAAATVALTTPGHAEGTASSAYGLAAVGPLPVEATPKVASTDGSRQTTSLAELPDNPLIELQAATVTAEADTASVQLVGTTVGGDLLSQLPEPPAELTQLCTSLPETGLPTGELPEPPALPIPGLEDLPSLEELPADDLRSLCQLLTTPPDSLLGAGVIEVACQGDSGTVTVADLDVLGQPVTIPSTAPNTEIPADPLLNITVNRQTSNADGSFTVEGLVVSVGDGTEVITLGSATCGNPRRTPPVAPAPVPVQAHVPVTG